MRTVSGKKWLFMSFSCLVRLGLSIASLLLRRHHATLAVGGQLFEWSLVMTHIPTEQERREHLRKIINSAQSGMMVTHSLMGMHGRPMANAEISEQFSSIWFATQRRSAKVEELSHDNRVFLGYHGGGTEWASIYGRARIVDDRDKIRELWSPYWKNWFSGPEDPELVLIEVWPESGEYWDSGNKLFAMVKFAVGTMIGRDLSREDNQKVTLPGMD
jgi:general stress protein 26